MHPPFAPAPCCPQSWKFVGDSPLPISGVQSPSLQLDTLDGGRPYLAFAAPSGGDTYLALVQRLSSRGNWTFVVTRPPTGLGQLASDVGQTQLALHPTIKGRPYAAFADIRGGGQCSVMVYLNSTWRYLGKRAFSAGVATGLTFAMDPKAKPVVAFQASHPCVLLAAVPSFSPACSPHVYSCWPGACRTRAGRGRPLPCTTPMPSGATWACGGSPQAPPTTSPWPSPPPAWCTWRSRWEGLRRGLASSASCMACALMHASLRASTLHPHRLLRLGSVHAGPQRC